jgi:hypothetical protein
MKLIAIIVAAALTSGCGVTLSADGSKSATLDPAFAARAIEIFATK